MRHERDTRFLDGIVAATLRRRDEDNVRIRREHQLGVELSLHTYLDYLTVLHALEDVLVKQVLRTRDAFHHVVGIKHGEVRQL